MYKIIEASSSRVVRTVKSVQAAQNIAEAMTETEKWARSGREYTYVIA